MPMDNDDLVCPYCGSVQYGHEPDEESADMCYTKCESCGKNFWYSVTVLRSYDPYKDDDEESEVEDDENNSESNREKEVGQ